VDLDTGASLSGAGQAETRDDEFVQFSDELQELQEASTTDFNTLDFRLRSGIIDVLFPKKTQGFRPAGSYRSSPRDFWNGDD
jgi:hypothetical protein